MDGAGVGDESIFGAVSTGGGSSDHVKGVSTSTGMGSDKGGSSCRSDVGEVEEVGMGRVGTGKSIAFRKVAAVTGVEKIFRHGFREEKRERRLRMTEFEAGFSGGMDSKTDEGGGMMEEDIVWVSVETLDVEKLHEESSSEA